MNVVGGVISGMLLMVIDPDSGGFSWLAVLCSGAFVSAVVVLAFYSLHVYGIAFAREVRVVREKLSSFRQDVLEKSGTRLDLNNVIDTVNGLHRDLLAIESRYGEKEKKIKKAVETRDENTTPP